MRTQTPARSRSRIGLLLGAAALTGLLGACQAAPGQEANHWNIESVAPRAAFNLFGYREGNGTFREQQWQYKQDINLTLRRHLLNSDPYNPFQADDPSVVAPRPPHSILPDPLTYFHLESIAVGSAFLAWTGVFIPIPVSSVIGTVERGGWSEFADGVTGTFSGKFHSSLLQPPPVSEFHVKNK